MVDGGFPEKAAFSLRRSHWYLDNHTLMRDQRCLFIYPFSVPSYSSDNLLKF